MRNCFYLVLILTIVFAGMLQAQTSNERLEKLEKVCNQQAQQIQLLQKRLGVLQDKTSYKKYTQEIVKEYLKEPAAEEEYAGITSGYDNGFFIRGAEGDLELKMTGFIQTGVGIFENDSYDNNGFFLNGVRLNFDMYFMKDWHARLQIDFASPGLGTGFRNSGSYSHAVRDAFVEYIGIPEFSVRVGQTHIPFSIEGQYAENGGLTIGSAPFTSWSHGRDLGFMVHGVLSNMIGYKAGIFNGVGANNTIDNDEFLMAAQSRFYFCGFDVNPNNFIHIGVMRHRHPDYGSSPDRIGLATPWGRSVFGTGAVANATAGDVQGWRTSADAGFRFDTDLDGGHGIRVESEFMYSKWERRNSSVRLSFLEGFGFLFGTVYRHCLNPENEGSGILTTVKFSYSDIDNEGDSGNILGQRVFVYTVGLGYAFNKHIALNFNWVIVDMDQKEWYGGPKKSSAVPTGKAGELEQAWLLQLTAQW